MSTKPSIYTRHAEARVRMRWRGRESEAPDARDFRRGWAPRLPPAMADHFGLANQRGQDVAATRDAFAVMRGNVVITVVRVGADVVDDVRATLLCRAMGLDVRVA